jgi:hypothetical protein
LLDLRVTNAGGQVATLPGIGVGKGTGFFLANHSRSVNLGSTVVQSAFDPSTGAEFFVLANGTLRSLGGARPIDSGVVAVSTIHGDLIAGLVGGGVEVMTETGAGVEIQHPEINFNDQPSALEALPNGNQIDVYATYQDQEAPVLFTFTVPGISDVPGPADQTGTFEGLLAANQIDAFASYQAQGLPILSPIAVPVITELSSTPAVVQVTSLADSSLILTAVLLQGNLVEVESAPAEEAFTQVVRIIASPLLFADAAVNDAPPAEAPQVLPADADLPVEAPLRSFRMGVEEALRQWLRDQRPAQRMESMLEALQGMLLALTETPEQLAIDVPAPAKQPPEEPKQPANKQEEQAEVMVEEAREETVFVPASTEAEVDGFTGMDLLPVLAAAAWLMERDEETTDCMEAC